MLTLWEADATASIISHINSTADAGTERLKMLVDIVSTMNEQNDYGGLRAEPAIRDWARSDAKVAKALDRVDEKRIGYVTSLFENVGCMPTLARSKALLLYSGFVGLQMLAANKQLQVKPQMMELLKLILSDVKTARSGS